MSAIHGKGTGIVLGQWDLTRWCHEVSSDSSVDTAEASCFDEPQGAKVYVQGLRDVTYSFGGREQGTVEGLRPTIEAIMETEESTPFIVGPAGGFGLAKVVQMGRVLTTSMNLSSPISDVVSVSGDLQADGGAALGYSLARKAGYDESTNETRVDLLTASTGYEIFLHVVENSHNDAAEIVVQHSTNGTTWVDLEDTEVTVEAGETTFLATSMSFALGRYVRVVVTLAGDSGTVTVRAGIAVKK